MCRCYERQRGKTSDGGDISLSHTGWIGGRSCPREREVERVQIVLSCESDTLRYISLDDLSKGWGLW